MKTITATATLLAMGLTTGLTGCSSSGSGGAAPTAAAPVTPTAPTPPAPTPPVARGGPTTSTGFVLRAGQSPLRSAPGTNATTLTETASAATFTSNVGGRTVAADLPLVAAATVPASAPNNPLDVPITARLYERETGTFGDPNYRDESLEVIDARYAQLAIYEDERGFDTVAEVAAVSPVDQATPRGVPMAGTATYRGVASGSFVGGDGSTTNIGVRQTTSLSGDVTMNADFGAGTIDGRISDRNTGFELTLENGVINGAEYAGEIDSITFNNQTVIDTGGPNDRAVFTGGFYGPEANETAGLIDVRGTDTQPGGRRAQVVGGFLATKQ